MKKKTTEQFIAEARAVHGDKYDYSKVNYVGALSKVCIICPEHGEFWQLSDKHLRGAKCPQCAKIEKKEKFFRYNLLSEYRSWRQMKQRCYNHKNTQYRLYGARGIIVCQRWLNSFENFLEDMGNKPDDSYTIDRIDVNGNYEPNNCRWATKVEQGNNRRNNRYITYKCRQYTISEFARLFDVPPNNVFADLKRGLTEKQIINKYENKTNMKYGKFKI